MTRRPGRGKASAVVHLVGAAMVTPGWGYGLVMLTYIVAGLNWVTIATLLVTAFVGTTLPSALRAITAGNDFDTPTQLRRRRSLGLALRGKAEPVPECRNGETPLSE